MCAFLIGACTLLWFDNGVAAQKENLGIAGFGISVTTMEEVFIKVGEGTDETLDERYTCLVGSFWEDLFL